MTLSSYPAGVTGYEYEIGGADAEEEATLDAPCPECGEPEHGFQETHWSFGTRILCAECGHEIEQWYGDDVDPDINYDNGW